MAHQADALVVTCIDFRFQTYIQDWLKKNVGSGNYDRVAWAGGVQDASGILKQLEISVRLHHIKTVYLINHEDCGAYGPTGTKSVHIDDLSSARKRVQSTFPQLSVRCLYLRLDGVFEAIN